MCVHRTGWSPHGSGRPYKEQLAGVHLGSGVWGQTLALGEVSCPPHSPRCATSLAVIQPRQALEDGIQIPVFQLLKWSAWWL